MPVTLIAGSRLFKGQRAYDIIFDLVSELPPQTIIVSGMAKGPDIYGHHAGSIHGFFVKEYPVADEEVRILGNRAFYVRDMIMGVYVREHRGNAHLFIQNGQLTRGTKIMRDFCNNFEIPYTLHDVSLSEADRKQPVRDWRKTPPKE